MEKTPHTQTQQNTTPEQSDLDRDEQPYEADSPTDEALYEHAEGAETGTNRSPREVQTRNLRHRTEPEVEAHEGSVSTRVPKKLAPGITDRPAEESERQEKVVEDRPDAQAGLHRPK